MQTKILKIIAATIALFIVLWALITLIGNFQNVDRDGDGLTDEMEELLGTDPLSQDSDNDGIPDGQEYDYWQNRSQQSNNENTIQLLSPEGDIDGDGYPNILDPDSDNDGMLDGQELEEGTDPADPDTDNDGLSDGDELLHGTDPTNPDSDGDGILDGADVDPTTPAGEGGLEYGPAEEGAGGDPTGAGGGGSGGGASPSVSPHRDGSGGVVTCYAVFDPALINAKRYVAYDAITEDYDAYIYDVVLYSLGLDDVVYDNAFVGTIPLTQLTDEAIPIPSVAPNANIISYYVSEPWLSAQFYKDGADNYYVAALDYNYYGEITLTFTTSADSSYFIFAVPGDLTLDDIPQSMKRTPPSSVVASAELIIDELGLTGETNLQTIVNTLYSYFSSFTEGEIPSEAEEPDIYLAMARAKHGACYVRSFACFVTANALGLPTRLVVNECHAFVELYIPTNGWMRMDLGGLGECRVCNPEGYDPFTNSTGPQGNQSQPGNGNGTVTPGGDRIPTITTITDVSSSAYKSGSFTVEGSVTDEEGTGVLGMPIEIYVLESKELAGSWNDFFAGEGITNENGIFSIEGTIPDAVPVGANQVVALSLGIDNYSGSWSDPTIDVYSNTTILFDMVSSIALTDELEIAGSLVDDGRQVLPEQAISLFIDGSSLGESVTNDDGMFFYAYTPTSLGHLNISATFDGDTYLSSAEADHQVVVRDLSSNISLSLNGTLAARASHISVQGVLSSKSEESMAGAPIHILFNGTKLTELVTSSQGTYSSTVTIPSNASLGNTLVKAHYPGTEVYAEANAEQTLFIQARTQLLLFELDMPYVEQNETLDVHGKLTDELGTPLVNMTIELLFADESSILQTNKTGHFNASYAFSTADALGTYHITSSFEGTDYYLASQDDLSFELVQAGSSNQHLSQNTYIVLAIAIAVIAVVIVGIIMLFKKRKIEQKPSIEEIATQTISRLRTESDHRSTVINCYKQMCDWLEQKGVKKGSYQTAREFALATRDYIKMSPESLYSLTQIFEKARYSPHDITSEDRDRAIHLLNEILIAPVEHVPEPEQEPTREGTNE
ncbi:MAG: DUF4129 domain-containing protein [Candidatus Thermoplasmatota archaeon]|nr:DUF4129 domain-containing protein [Candidatus Thermoplasmatota archaeon]